MKKFFLVAGSIGLIALIYLYVVLFSSNTNELGDKAYVYIPTGSSYEQLLSSLQQANVLKNMSSFDKMARRMGLPKSIHAGKYQIKNGMGNFTIVRMLAAGKQVPVRLVINKLRTEKDLIRKVCSQLEVDSNDLAKLFRDTSFLSKYQVDSFQIQCLFLPDTYQFYWNTTALKVVEKIARNFQKFWTNERKDQAKKLGLTIPQVITIASIVEEETNKSEDKPKIASTYLNRIKKGMPLQADPTVKFAVGDFGIKRVLKVHTQHPSPYNTYLSTGLPPGPICTPGIQSIEAVLNAPSTNYIYFCAREDLKGFSNFASTYEEHLQNAKRYQEALNQRGIK